jgi:glycosyltransferase involved in cell wall biosynthesis
MAKESLAIVSSYDELCGNASYTKALVDGLSKYFDVTVISLNVEMLRKGEIVTGDLHIQEICRRLKSFDCVNIQFEAGLFGSDLALILNRFLAIAKSSKRFVMTMHRFHAKEKYPSLKLLVKSLIQKDLKKRLFDFQFAYVNNRYLPLYNKVIAFCKKKGAPIIVHTKRECELIKNKFKYDKVYDHPLCFYEQGFIESIKKKYSRKEFCNTYSLDNNKRYIGIFGFISNYKCHETIIKALKYLPNRYELLIFGAQHPHTIKLEEKINPYINKLIELIIKERLEKRVKFYGSLNDDNFLKALMCCDFNVLPYLEVNQGGSAIAALSLETGVKSIFSQNCAFLELAKYAPNCFKMFSVGNYLELGQSILNYCESDYKINLKDYYSKYNIKTSAHLYQKLLSGVFEIDVNEEKVLHENCKFEHATSI